MMPMSLINLKIYKDTRINNMRKKGGSHFSTLNILAYSCSPHEGVVFIPTRGESISKIKWSCDNTTKRYLRNSMNKNSGRRGS